MDLGNFRFLEDASLHVERYRREAAEFRAAREYRRRRRAARRHER